ncbi:fumarylacetoacetate hydrolase family protein (plasmid) [Tistrella mobilis]|uniref:fumarylacetoacetate hydrolase family protein n=1 Tax=Tistrella mobilis TaxID=171437 RepID=UPI0035562E50
MKFLTFRDDAGEERVARLDGDGLARALSHPDGSPIRDLVGVIAGRMQAGDLVADDAGRTPDGLRLLAPIPRPARNLFCVGKNYTNHAREFTQSGFDAGHGPAEAIPGAPIVFSKTPQTVVAHGDPVWDAAGVSEALDYEAELAVIIGRGGRGIARTDAMAHVWGYTILNDVTARDWQKRHKQWHMAKSFDSFGPMGPVAVTADEVDGANLDLRCWINGELRQHANTRDLIFDIPTLIETISAGITLMPGDIIATGTPEGVGIGFEPPRFLKAGDVMTIEIAGIGRLENEVRP